MRRIYDSVLVSIIGSSVRAFLSSRFLIRIGASHHSQHKQLTIRLFKQKKIRRQTKRHAIIKEGKSGIEFK